MVLPFLGTVVSIASTLVLKARPILLPAKMWRGGEEMGGSSYQEGSVPPPLPPPTLLEEEAWRVKWWDFYRCAMYTQPCPCTQDSEVRGCSQQGHWPRVGQPGHYLAFLPLFHR